MTHTDSARSGGRQGGSSKQDVISDGGAYGKVCSRPCFCDKIMTHFKRLRHRFTAFCAFATHFRSLVPIGRVRLMPSACIVIASLLFALLPHAFSFSSKLSLELVRPHHQHRGVSSQALASQTFQWAAEVRRRGEMPVFPRLQTVVWSPRSSPRTTAPRTSSPPRFP